MLQNGCHLQLLNFYSSLDNSRFLYHKSLILCSQYGILSFHQLFGQQLSQLNLYFFYFLQVVLILDAFSRFELVSFEEFSNAHHFPLHIISTTILILIFLVRFIAIPILLLKSIIYYLHHHLFLALVISRVAPSPVFVILII